LIALFAVLVAAAPAGAQDSADAIVDKIVNAPPPDAHVIYGAKGKVRKDEGVQGGKALRVSIPGKSAEPWSVGLNSALTKPVKAGDMLVLAFWARLEKAEGATATLPNNSIQLSSEPYTPLFNQAVEIGPEWKLHEVRGKADKDYAAGALTVSLHLASGKQVLDFGPVFVLNMGQ
jgi:hypothetical protein